MRKVAEHGQQRLEHVRSLVQLRTHIEKEKQHVCVTRRILLARLRRNEMTRTDFENKIKDAQETLREYEKSWQRCGNQACNDALSRVAECF